MDICAVVILFAAFCQSSGFHFGVSNACYGQGPCSRHELTCGNTDRLAIISAVHGFKRKESLCPSLAVNTCSFNTKFCCKEDEVYDCTFPFKNIYMRSLYEQCSGKFNCSYYTDRVQEACTLSTRTLSSFSSIRFSCISETEMVDFDTVGSTRGKSVFLAFDPELYLRNSDKVQQYSCRVEPATSSTPVNVSINALDIRFDKMGEKCSSVLIRQNDGHVTNITCGPYGRRTFLSSVTHIGVSLTPIDLLLNLVPENLPGYVWIHVEAEYTELELRCGALEAWWGDDWPAGDRKVLNTPDNTSMTAVIGGVLVLLVLAAVLAGVIIWKRRANVTKYLQTIPLNESISKEDVERRLRAQSGCSETIDLTIQQPDTISEKTETLQVRPAPKSTNEPIYDRIKFADETPTTSAVGVYDHLRHVLVDQDKVDGYDKCLVGMVKIGTDNSAYDTTESASRDTDDVKRDVAYDHLNGNTEDKSLPDNIYENTTPKPDEENPYNDVAEKDDDNMDQTSD
ncbi:uncharacterized protein [Haliotis asinina]|uniref:uncharacterized protein n=1 Tax=Haliotis asinina TaxID=109174 RepID=UPI0035325447